jgi:ABC-type multidrug transport system ATPase subunit
MAKVPGPSVGYMPQEVALFQKFSILETFQYFGKIFGKPKSEVREIGERMVSFLQLPDVNQTVNNLSGGQQRRLSLAVALFNNPELLILDEPTVGVDAILRESIWDHLVNLATTGNTTIIITTHYIDECRRANMIGLMRNGRLLAEEHPSQLLATCGTETLEDAFLKLSQSQEKGSYEFQVQKSEYVPQPNRHRKRLPSTHWHHMAALIWKNFLWMRRNLNTAMFLIWFPILNMVGFYYTIGQEPKNTPVSVVNYEFSDNFVNCPTSFGCEYVNLSCHYLRHLQDFDVRLVSV